MAKDAPGIMAQGSVPAAAAGAFDVPLVYRQFAVHHCTADGILVQLPSSAGFGRLTLETLGGDALADALLKSFAGRSAVPAIVTRKRDRQGYRLLTVNLAEAWSEILSYALPVRRLLPTLVRKHLLKGLGTTTVAKLVKKTNKGTIFKLPQNMVGLAVMDATTSSTLASSGTTAEEGSELEVRLLNYDVGTKTLSVSADPSVVESTPLNTEAAAAALSTLHPGDRVTAKVLLSSTDDQCAVVAVPTSVGCQLLGYYIYDWGADASAGTAAAAATQANAKPAVGATLTLCVEMVPESRSLQEALPFLILSQREAFAGPPSSRQGRTLSAVAAAISPATAMEDGNFPLLSSSPLARSGGSASDGLVGHFLWRDGHQHHHAGGACCHHLRQHRAGDTASDEDDVDNDADTAARIRRRRMEEAVDAYERQMENTAPTSPEEFQRLLLASPNSSYLWTQYMAFHVKLQQLEDARQIAEKALRTIGAREEEERLNVWVAYMNLENLYGTGESLNAIFKRALPMQSDPLVLHERLADIFEACRKPHQLLTLCRTMTNKWRHKASTWERLGRVLIDQNKRDQLKRMIKDMGESLKKDDAATVVVRLAIREFKQGSVENGRALFEGLLAKIPKKSDVWFAFIDQEVGLMVRKAPQASLNSVRNVLDRAAAMNFTAKVMQMIFTKYMNFEKSFGTAKEVDKVKQMARSYVDAKIQSVAQPGVPATL